MPQDVDVLALENQVCFALAVASRSVIGLYRPVLEPLGLTHPQYLVMLALWQQDPRSVKELGAALQLEPATLSPLLKRLEASGLIDRRRSAADERRLDVTLTEAGRALRSRAESIPQTMIEQLGMPVAELQAMQASLTAIIAAATRSSD
ncbi:MarR family transcriptional regulator [Agreia sp. Leaf335]|uniref:MarR family winged helix-turn-helix transcriptional regulator n=1 Tax=Agreia sp. Leaf335 TaxID=1736340 RepID=UPI0006F84ABC|nr:MULTISPECIES: MarR family transcriptional regulator [Microbacteriaceae]KQR22259.1 MarR family transcriptional regulator [Agreia sp. Leaf335]PPF61054.1 MarR family transcriptional regulator [Clavibacter michiganensis]